jgi:hypothetical protein
MVIILTNGSKQLRLDRVERFSEVLKDQFALFGSKLVVTLMTWKLSNVLFLPRVTL